MNAELCAVEVRRWHRIQVTAWQRARRSRGNLYRRHLLAAWYARRVKLAWVVKGTKESQHAASNQQA